MPFDFDPNLRAATETALGQGGADAVDLMDRLKARQAESRSRALEQVNKGLKPDDYFDKEEEIKQRLYGDRSKGIESESAPLYRAAFDANPAVASAQLGKLMDTPSGQKAVKNAMKTMKDKGLAIGKVNPVTGAVMKPSLEFLNQVKIEMDNLVGAAKTAGKDAKARDVSNLRTAFRNELDTATTDPATGTSPYKEARTAYDERKAQLDALQMGRENFGRMQPQEVVKKMGTLNFEQRDAFRTGVAQSIRQMLEAPSTDINAAKRLIGSPAMSAKLEAMFDTPHEFALFKTALDKEVETFENSQKLLQRESTVRQRGAEPPKGRIERGAETAPSLGLFSPTHWALKILRSKPEIKPEEAAEVIRLMKSSTPDEMAEFEKALGSKFGRKAARKTRGSRMGVAGALLGTLAGTLTGGENEGASTPPPDDAILSGLSPEEREMAMRPAKAKGGRIEAVKELVDDLKTRMSGMDLSQISDQIHNIAVKTGELPDSIWKMVSDKPAPWASPVNLSAAAPTTPITRIPAQPERLAPFARSMDYEKARLDAIRRSIVDSQTMDPNRAKSLQPVTSAADMAYDRMMSDPTYENMQHLSELVRNLQLQSKRRGGRIMRQFGGGTNHA